jgi:membrane protein DedA with SNARE-associated domain
MDSLLSTIQAHFPFFINHKYLLLFVATLIDGFGTFLVAGFLVSIRAVSVMPTFIVLVTGDILNGMIWYAIGYYGGNPFLEWRARKSQKTRDRIHRIRAYAEEFTGRAVLLANLTSLTTITNTLVGALRYPFSRFMIYNSIGSFFKPTIILVFGYFYGESYQAFVDSFTSPWALLGAGLLMVPFMYLIRIVLVGISNRYLGLWDAILHMRRKIKTGIDKLIDPEPKNDKDWQ